MVGLWRMHVWFSAMVIVSPTFQLYLTCYLEWEFGAWWFINHPTTLT